MSKQQISVRISDSLLVQLNSYLDQTGTSKTDGVSRAIAEYLGCDDCIPLSQRVAELEKRVIAIASQKNLRIEKT